MKNRQVETLRGLACILLVAYHVIGADPANGLRVADGPVRVLNDGLAYLRMPLFTFLSGLVYGLRPFGGDSRSFLVGKCRRLLIPMLVVGTLFALLQAAVPGTNAVVSDWHLLHIVPVAHFWFVESLFWVFVLIWLLERFHLIDHPAAFAMAWIASAVLYLAVAGPHWFSINGAVYLLPHFLGGLAVSRFGLWPRLARPWPRALLLAIALLAVVEMGMPTPHADRRTLWMLLAGVSLCGFCLSLRLDIGWLARIGTYSYAIYLFHVFFTAASRIALERAGLAVLPLQLVAGVLVGVAGPMLIDTLASRNRWLALALLGKSVRKRTPRNMAAKDGAVAKPADAEG